MARAWLVNGKAIAKKIKNATHSSNYQIKDVSTGANRECPNCKQLIDNSDVTLEWPGFPAGVKFDPTDAEVLDHLAAKLGLGDSTVHAFIDEFIPTLEEEQGICYTHPENLPGIKKDGSSVHFFHKTSNAYATGRCKRRKIDRGCSSTSDERVRWHKTGKTKPVMENGVQKGWKKIMVLYRSLKKGCKPDRANWVMHQYHLGFEEEEKSGELVVSKIFYQHNQKQIDKIDNEVDKKECNILAVGTDPETPYTNISLLPLPKEHSISPNAPENNLNHLAPENELYETVVPFSIVHQKDEVVDDFWWAGESQAVEEPNPDFLDESMLCNVVRNTLRSKCTNTTYNKGMDVLGGIPALEDIEMDTPPDFQLPGMQFGSQDSITNWIDQV